MTEEQRRRLRGIKRFDQLRAYLRDELEWPIDDGIPDDDLTFDWSGDDLGLKHDELVAIKEIKQLRPLESGQPWGIFFINFEKKRLPIVILRRILNALVMKKRASANKSQQAAWKQNDLLFISAYGEDSDRQITFAHFSEPTGELTDTKPTLRVLGWDANDANLALDYVSDTLHEKLTWPADTKDLKAWRQRWSEAFELRHRQVIDTAQDLAQRLAELAQRIRDRAEVVLGLESEKGALRTLMKGFRTALIHDLDEKGFADMYAQTITYGLFSAAVSRTVPGAGTVVVQEDMAAMVPVTNPFLKEMLESFLKAGGRKGKLDFDELGIQEVVDLLRDPKTRLDAVLRDFGDKTRGEDPVIHFYEHFLSAYNKQLKIQRGVFYTPQPVVSYIVRSVHELLQTEFGLADGLADTTTWGEMLKKHPGLKLPTLTDDLGREYPLPNPDTEPFVQILDPATGTATFLVEVIDVIHRTLAAKWKQQRLTDTQQRTAWNDYVPQHLLPRLHAFELMMAPYAIAHMKIGLKLAETGYRFGAEERARIYLTNALEPWVKQLPLIGFDALAHEAAAVNEIKRHKRFTVVIGNPPYSNFGQLNKNPFILGLLDDYKRDLNERKLNLDDDYIKFIRLGQWFIDRSALGLLSYISANSYVDGAGHRKMRQLLLGSFDSIRIANLHGNLRKKETAPDGNADENVFDIMQGVAIALMRKTPATSGSRDVEVADIWGGRQSKYDALNRASINHDKIHPIPGLYLLVQQANTFADEYGSYPSLREVFHDIGQGIEMGRTVALGESKAQVEQVISDLRELTNESFARKYEVPESSATWGVERAREDVRKNPGRCLELMVRPFDEGWTYYTGRASGFHHRPRAVSTTNMLLNGNLAIVAKRQSKESEFSSVWVVNKPINQGFFSIDPLGRESLFPLYREPEASALQSTLLDENQSSKDNFNTALLAERLDLDAARFPGTEVFGYAYAVFHSPDYRSRYAEFLKIDFPRLPLTGNLELFRAVARLGDELTTLHLLESPKLDKPITEFIGGPKKGSGPEVEKVSWSRNTVWVDKAQTTGFKGVPEAVWNFHIGGYQVCEKWLKDRKGRALSKDDIAHYHKIVVALSETIRLMAEIDQVIEKHGGWPDAFQQSRPNA